MNRREGRYLNAAHRSFGVGLADGVVVAEVGYGPGAAAWCVGLELEVWLRAIAILIHGASYWVIYYK